VNGSCARRRRPVNVLRIRRRTDHGTPAKRANTIPRSGVSMRTFRKPVPSVHLSLVPGVSPPLGRTSPPVWSITFRRPFAAKTGGDFSESDSRRRRKLENLPGRKHPSKSSFLKRRLRISPSLAVVSPNDCRTRLRATSPWIVRRRPEQLCPSVRR